MKPPFQYRRGQYGNILEIVAADDSIVADVYAANVENAEFVAAMFAVSPLMLAALKSLIADEDNREERSLDPFCQDCTEGCTPNHLVKGPCAYHQAVAVIRAAEKLLK